MERDQLDPRAERTRLAMIEAIGQIIVEDGPHGVTHQRVAERANVGRATVYRHWSTVEAMLLSVFELYRFPDLTAEGQTLSQRLMALLRWIANQFARPEVRAFILAISERSQRDTAYGDVQRARMAEFRQGIVTVLRDANVPLDGLEDSLMPRLVGPIWFRVLVQGAPADDALITGIVEDFIGHLRK